MKKNQNVIDVLNQVLNDVSNEIFQYMIHSQMCNNWELEIIHRKIENRSFETMKQAQSLIERIVTLKGIPAAMTTNQLTIGKDVFEMFDFDLKTEKQTIRKLEHFIKVCFGDGDQESAKMLELILKDKMDQKEWIEDQQAKINDLGKDNYLDWAASFLHEV